MKKLILLLTFVLFASSQAFAVGVYGPAQPEGKAGELSIGGGYLHYNGRWNHFHDVKQKQAYLQVGYAISDKIGIYLMGGGADINTRSPLAYDDSYRSFGSVGFKWLLTNRSPLGIGIFAQGAYFNDHKDGAMTLSNNYEFSGGVVMQGEIEGAYLYGGPLLFTRAGDISIGSWNGTYEELTSLGGMAGIRWPLKNKILIDLETQYKTRLSVGTAIHFRF